MKRRERDECFKCGRAVPWDKQLNVPTHTRKPRCCCFSCGLTLSGRLIRRMSRRDQERLTAFGINTMFGGAPRRSLGLTPRKRGGA